MPYALFVLFISNDVFPVTLTPDILMSDSLR